MSRAGTEPRVDEQDQLFVAWKAISNDLAWKTLVLETIVEERRWIASFRSLSEKPLDGIKSLCEKFWSKENPATRTAGITLASLLTLVVGHTTIRLVADPDLKKALLSLGTVPLTLDLPTPGQLPHFSIDTTGLASQLPTIPISPDAPTLKLASSPLRLEDPDGLLARTCCRRDESAQIAQELHRISTELAGEPNDEIAVAQNQEKIGQPGIDEHQGSTPLSGPSEGTLLGEMRNQTHEFQNHTREMTDQLEQMNRQVEALQGQIAEAKNQTHELQTQNASLRNSLKIGSFSSHLEFSGTNEVQSVSFPVLTSDGSVKLVPLRMELVAAAGNGARARVSVNLVSTDDGKTVFDGQIDEGAAKSISSLNATLMLNSVERRWLVRHVIRISITPN